MTEQWGCNYDLPLPMLILHVASYMNRCGGKAAVTLFICFAGNSDANKQASWKMGTWSQALDAGRSLGGTLEVGKRRGEALDATFWT